MEKVPGDQEPEHSRGLSGEIDFLDVGRIVGLHGVRGKVKVAAFSGDPEGVLAARTLRLTGGRGTAPGTVGDYEVVTAQRAGGCAVFALLGVDTLEAAENLVKAVASVRRKELPSLPEDEFYWADAVGCLVVDEGGAPLGKVVAVEPGAAHDWLVVRRPGGEDGYLPVAAAFLRKVDTAARRVVASPPEGW
ncbi:MAG: 16S rRNA processing protein RimM [Deltaproteobacteria bacterium GWB2_65_81]|nr:MAG: 16S rRNA processing protein RimM [Deltaproteobacteria bacterium GWA2_65_63]OGP27439.1 MAG: 16S rRNA processing protein RimM [Deltaproteobacteria bacterium GWB2_65_81]OGP37443.1 MAG: 16S rRNA processing protein RimM [Deltaproteobacteria bacterium GWC2_66_88]